MKSLITINQYGDPLRRLLVNDADEPEVHLLSGELAVFAEMLPVPCYWDVVEDQWVAKPTKPSANHSWDGASKAWVDLRELAEVKARKNHEINQARLTANSSGFTFGGKTIASDGLSRSDIDGTNGLVTLIGGLPPGWPGAWKAVDNTYVAIPDVPTWVAFYGAMVAQGMTNFAYSQALKTLLANAATLGEVDAIHWGMTL